MDTKATSDKNACQKKTINTVEGSFIYRVCEKDKLEEESHNALKNDKK
jgi:hypothetical protein